MGNKWEILDSKDLSIDYITVGDDLLEVANFKTSIDLKIVGFNAPTKHYWMCCDPTKGLVLQPPGIIYDFERGWHKNSVFWSAPTRAELTKWIESLPPK